MRLRKACTVGYGDASGDNSGGADNNPGGANDNSAGRADTSAVQTATSETQQWIDSLYNALIQDDAKTVVTLLGNVENVRTHCASYAYAWNNNRSDTCEGFLLTASDGTQFGVGLFAENGYQYIEAFVSVSDDEHGFHCFYAGDHYVEIVEGWGYNYLKGDEFF